MQNKPPKPKQSASRRLKIINLVYYYLLYNLFQSSVIPICLPWELNDPGRNNELDSDGNISLTISGWGAIAQSRNTVTDSNCKRLNNQAKILQKASIPNVSNNKCTNFDFYKKRNLDMTTVFCAGGNAGK